MGELALPQVMAENIARLVKDCSAGVNVLKVATRKTVVLSGFASVDHQPGVRPVIKTVPGQWQAVGDHGRSLEPANIAGRRVFRAEFPKAHVDARLLLRVVLELWQSGGV